MADEHHDGHRAGRRYSTADDADAGDVPLPDGRSPPVLVRCPPRLLAAIDAARSDVGRAQWLRDAAEQRLGGFARGELSPLVGALVKATGDLGRCGGLLKLLAEGRGGPRAEIHDALRQLAAVRDQMAQLRDHVVDRLGRRRAARR